jgi:signal peptidase I
MTTKARRRLAVTAVAVSVLLVAAIATAVAGYALSYTVEGRSMAPTLEPGHRVLTAPFSGDYSPARLDIVVAHPTPGSAPVVKRVVGMPGDQVRMTDGRAHVRPGGAGPWLSLAVPGTADAWHSTPRTCCTAEGTGGVDAAATVPPGHVWLLGDNIPVSDDSRAYGFLPLSAIDAPLWLRTWPVGSAGELVGAAGLVP